MEDVNDNPQFKNKLTIILSCLGCAVGTGNIWRFPRILANNSRNTGGLVFILLWCLFLVTWSIPIFVIEYAIGRFRNKGVVASLCHLVSDKFAWLWGWIVMVTFLISAYYSVIVGWCLYYVYRCTRYALPDTPQESRDHFRGFAEDHGWEPVVCTLAVCSVAGLAVFKGVKSFEIVSSILMGILLIIIVIFFGASLFMEHASVGIQFVLTPDWDSFGHISTYIDALSQNAFDTSAGAGMILSFATYLSARHGIVKYAVLIPVLNNAVSLVCALTIFGGVFSTMITSYGYLSKEGIIDIIMDSGPGNTGLTFIWLPVLCNTLGSALGRVVAVFLFLCLTFAGITTLISSMELFSRTFTDFGFKRPIAVGICTVSVFLVSLPSSLNIHILNNQDFVWAFALIINGLVFAVVVFTYGADRFRQRVINDFSLHGVDWRIYRPYFVFLVLLVLEGSGLLLWWAFDLVINDSKQDADWDELGEKTFTTTIFEWLCLAILLGLANLIYIYTCQRYQEDRGAADERPLNEDFPEEHVAIFGPLGGPKSDDSGHSSQSSVKIATVTGV